MSRASEVGERNRTLATRGIGRGEEIKAVEERGTLTARYELV